MLYVNIHSLLKLDMITTDRSFLLIECEARREGYIKDEILCHVLVLVCTNAAQKGGFGAANILL